MVRALEDIQQDAMQLSPKDKAAFATHLLATLDGEAEDDYLEKLWAEEAERRYQEYLQGRMTARPAKEVFEGTRPQPTM